MAGRPVTISEKVFLELIEEVRGLRVEVRELLAERDPQTTDLRELGIAAAHGDKKAAKRFGELARQMKAEGKSAAEILKQAG